MANITRYGPFEDMFNELTRGFYVKPLSFPTGQGTPDIKLDVKERDKDYTVRADIPGVKKEDIHVDAEGSHVSVRAEVKRIAVFLALGAAAALPALADDSAQQAKLITSVQAQLGVPASGKMDEQTQAAVKRFQQAKGIESTGELDKKTLGALGMGGPKPAPAAAGASSEAKPSTPVGAQQSSAERTAEPTIKQERPTGEANK